MEYFVDEMPRDCASCKHYHMNCADGYSCSKLRKEIHPNFSEGIGYRHQDCPLQSLSDYTKQVRKEVVEDFYDEIRHRAILEDDYCPDHKLERKYGVRKCLLENIRSAILKKYGGEDE